MPKFVSVLPACLIALTGAMGLAALSAQATTTYAVPPSPYGQVGDPFLHTLIWPGKTPDAKPAATPAVLKSATQTAPKPDLSAYPDPGAADDPDLAPRALQTQATAAAPPSAQAAASGLYDSGYQVPATSPYAARIKAAREASRDAVKTASAAAPTPQTPTPQAPTPQAPPQAAPQAAAPSGDHVFVPGEHYTDASEAPRFYSLHREYGYHPDPITVDEHPEGALLTLTPDRTARQTDDDGDADATSDATPGASSAASGQKATS